jgi:hypothetical protein
MNAEVNSYHICRVLVGVTHMLKGDNMSIFHACYVFMYIFSSITSSDMLSGISKCKEFKI